MIRRGELVDAILGRPAHFVPGPTWRERDDNVLMLNDGAIALIRSLTGPDGPEATQPIADALGARLHRA